MTLLPALTRALSGPAQTPIQHITKLVPHDSSGRNDSAALARPEKHNSEEILTSESVQTKQAPDLRRYRMRVASRSLVAIGGGYALAAASAAAGAIGFQWFGMARSDATMAATMLSFIVYAIAGMWAFGCASVTRAWVGIGLPGLALALLAWVLTRGVQS